MKVVEVALLVAWLMIAVGLIRAEQEESTGSEPIAVRVVYAMACLAWPVLLGLLVVVWSGRASSGTLAGCMGGSGKAGRKPEGYASCRQRDVDSGPPDDMSNAGGASPQHDGQGRPCAYTEGHVEVLPRDRHNE